MTSPSTSQHSTHAASPLFRFVQMFCCMGVALVMWLKFGRPYTAMTIGTVGLVVLVVGLTAPHLLRPIDKAVAWLVLWVGILMTWLTLVPFFWLCLVPGRLVLLISGKDPMCRKWDASAVTYWTPKAKRSGGPQAQF